MSVRDRIKNMKENEAVKVRPCPSSPEVVLSPLFLNEESYVRGCELQNPDREAIKTGGTVQVLHLE